MTKPLRLLIAGKVLMQLLRDAEEFAKRVNNEEEGVWREVCRALCDARLSIEERLTAIQLQVEHETGIYLAFSPEVDTSGLLDPRWTGD